MTAEYGSMGERKSLSIHFEECQPLLEKGRRKVTAGVS
jgi:hypothetical protein